MQMTGLRRVAGVILVFVVCLSGCAKEESQGVSAQPLNKPTQPADKEGKASWENQTKASLQPESTSDEAKPASGAKPWRKLTQEEQEQIDRLKGQTTYFKGPKFEKQVALTFDDGPDRHYTVQILNILKREQVPATFFVLGKMAKKYPEVLKRIDQEGHVIGNHSFSHPQLTKLRLTESDWQIIQTNKLIYQTIHKTPLLIRPPYGLINKGLESHYGQEGYKVIEWSVDTQDWAGPSPAKIVQTVQKEMEPGGIILQHCAGGKQLEATVKALPVLIKDLKEQGYQFVTVDQLLGVPAYKEYKE
jgi:peptidoglycan/xylan/chitin deacetylase (PgdA/CDA1 family)